MLKKTLLRSKSKILTMVLSAMLVSSTLTAYADTDLIGTTVSPGSDGESSLLTESKLPEVEERFGSIDIRLSDGEKGTSKEGVKISVLKVADIEKGEYVLDDAYKNTGVDLNDIQNASELEAAATKIADVAGTGTVLSTDMNGRTTFQDLEVGVYLIEATDDSKYDDITPLLLSIPTWSEEDETMMYDLDVNPKHTPKPEEGKTHKSAPQTNLDSPIVLYFGGAAVTLVALVALNVAWKKKSNNNK